LRGVSSEPRGFAWRSQAAGRAMRGAIAPLMEVAPRNVECRGDRRGRFPPPAPFSCCRVGIDKGQGCGSGGGSPHARPAGYAPTGDAGRGAPAARRNGGSNVRRPSTAGAARRQDPSGPGSGGPSYSGSAATARHPCRHR